MSVPQKNSGSKNKGKMIGRENHDKVVKNFIDDLEEYDGCVDSVYIGKISKLFGNSRVEVLYQKKSNDEILIGLVQATIPGKFQGRKKREFWIESGSLVLVSDTGLGFEILSVINKDDLHTIKKFTKIHQNISGDEVIDDMFAKAEDEEELKIDDI
jgi:hypothetical protein